MSIVTQIGTIRLSHYRIFYLLLQHQVNSAVDISKIEVQYTFDCAFLDMHINIYINTICMYLFPFQVKCDHYWPFTEDPVAYGDITVEMLSEEEHTDWVYRNFRISYVSETFGMVLLKGWE